LEYVPNLGDTLGVPLTEAVNMCVIEFFRGYHSESQHYLLDSLVFYVLIFELCKDLSFVESCFVLAEEVIQLREPLAKYGNQVILMLRKVFDIFKLLSFLCPLYVSLKLRELSLIFHFFQFFLLLRSFH
jgi:hypothetical protein